MLSSPNYDAFEANRIVSVCAVIMAQAIKTTVNVQLSSHDSTARSENDNTRMLKHNSILAHMGTCPGYIDFYIEAVTLTP